MGDFPRGLFFIRNAVSSLVLDVEGSSKTSGAKIVLWNRKDSGYDNQLWSYDNGFIVNMNSGLVLEVPGYEGGGHISPNTGLVQAERRDKPDSLNQLWAYNQQHLMPYDPRVSVGAENDEVGTPGTRAAAIRFDMHNPSQQWIFDPQD